MQHPKLLQFSFPHWKLLGWWWVFYPGNHLTPSRKQPVQLRPGSCSRAVQARNSSAVELLWKWSKTSKNTMAIHGSQKHNIQKCWPLSDPQKMESVPFSISQVLVVQVLLLVLFEGNQTGKDLLGRGSFRGFKSQNDWNNTPSFILEERIMLNKYITSFVKFHQNTWYSWWRKG